MDMVYCTMILGMALGRICLNRMRMIAGSDVAGGLYKHAVLFVSSVLPHQTGKLGDIEYRNRDYHVIQSASQDGHKWELPG